MQNGKITRIECVENGQKFMLTLADETGQSIGSQIVDRNLLFVIPLNPDFQCAPPRPDQMICAEGYYFLLREDGAAVVVSPDVFEFFKVSIN